MDGCGVSSWILLCLVLLLVIPFGIRTCSDNENETPVNEREQMQRIGKIKDAEAEERAIKQQLTISLETAIERTLQQYGEAPSVKAEESNSSKEGGDQ